MRSLNDTAFHGSGFSAPPCPLTDLANVVDAGQRAFKETLFLVMDALHRRCRHVTG